MSFEGIDFFSAVLLVSNNAEKLADFYKNTLMIPLVDEQHGDSPLHYGCELGDIHFAIHPAENSEGEKIETGSVKLAFEVFDMDAFVERMKSKNVDLLYPPKEMGPMKITAIKDPDGNIVEFTQLAKGWIDHLEKQRNNGNCIIQRWKKINA